MKVVGINVLYQLCATYNHLIYDNVETVYNHITATTLAAKCVAANRMYPAWM